MRIVSTCIPDTASLNRFTELTGDLIRNGELGKLKVCFESIESLLQSGEQPIRDAVHKQYIPSLASFMQECHLRTPFLNLMPRGLYTLFTNGAES
jgi:hypothetical protein